MTKKHTAIICKKETKKLLDDARKHQFWDDFLLSLLEAKKEEEFGIDIKRKMLLEKFIKELEQMSKNDENKNDETTNE